MCPEACIGVQTGEGLDEGCLLRNHCGGRDAVKLKGPGEGLLGPGALEKGRPEHGSTMFAEILPMEA